MAVGDAGRFGRVLSPAVPAHWVTAPTVYHPRSLLLAEPAGGRVELLVRALETIADRDGFRIDRRTNRILFGPRTPGQRSPDAFTLLAELREDRDLGGAVELNHVMSMAEQVGGNPLALGRGRPGLDQYGVTGYSGRGPVVLAGRTPRPVPTTRTVRVVVLDTGIGDHPWFRCEQVVDRVQLASGGIIGPQIDPSAIRHPLADSEGLVPDRMLGWLGTHSGHGTFIAGLLRQSCPAAEIVALAVMGADGIVDENVLIDALTALLTKQREDPGWADALVLSLGYYAETSEDVAYGSQLRKLLVDLGRAGVAVFCAAGNDATAVPSYPAAFAVHPDYADPDVVPLTSVAALNPDGTLAAFSNDGPWVTAQEMGVNLVSTAPVRAQGGQQPGTATLGPGRRRRAATDPDDFAGGFASWSGTSFAAPVLAGRYLTLLARCPDLTVSHRRELLLSGWRADRSELLRIPDHVPVSVGPEAAS